MLLWLLLCASGLAVGMEKNNQHTELRSLSELLEQEDLNYISMRCALSLTNKSLTDLSGIADLTLGQTCLASDLKVLIASKNYIKTIPGEILKFTQLKGLYVENNQIEQLPDQIYKMTCLEQLDLCNNNVSILLPQVTNLSNLGSLKLNNNQLSNMPCMSPLTRLRILDLRNNQLTSLMCNDKCVVPTQLNILDISYNKLVTLPNEINQLTNLDSLDISHNVLQNQTIKWKNFKKLITVACEAINLETIPEGFEQLGANAQKYYLIINLSRNKLKTLPVSFASLNHPNKLFLLNLSSNCFSVFPTVLPTISQLRSLDLSYNQIGVIPTEIGILTKLSYLLLKNNKIRVIPDELAKCIALEELDLSGNYIKVVPSVISLLSHLRLLNVDNNVLHSLPAEIGGCSYLQTLSLNNNHVEDLPESITQLTAINNLKFLENHQKLLTFIFDDKNNKTIFNFIQRLRIQKKVQYGNPLQYSPLPNEMKREIYTHVTY